MDLDRRMGGLRPADGFQVADAPIEVDKGRLGS